jgi:release factor glutamine methyltransferase
MTATLYYKLPPDKIAQDITQSSSLKKITIKGRQFIVLPHVYPSDKFRTTDFLLESIQPLLNGATVCDMGCGMGIVGLFAIENKAKKVVQVDINPFAVKNAKANRRLHQYTEDQLYIIRSDCFERVLKQSFDLIVFNIPFHSEPYNIKDPLEYAFYDPAFTSTTKFLLEAKNFSHQDTKIIIAFSDKGDVAALEKIFDELQFTWKLWKRTNSDQKFDNRLYELKNG